MGGIDMKTLNIGVIGCGFMGRTHSNAFRQAPQFFDLPLRPVLKTICARNGEKAKAFAGWRRNVELLEEVGMPKTVGFQADMAHTMLFTMGFNAPEDRLLPENFEWSQSDALAAAYRKMAGALRPWTFDFHVAQNDGTVKGSGSHDKTGRHCQPLDPNGKLDIVRDAGAWMCDDSGEPTRAFAHICWDGCMFPNSVLSGQQIWNEILSAMIAVRNVHGWD